MFCENCGTKIEDGAAFCPNCGNKVEAVNTESAAASTQENVSENVSNANAQPVQTSVETVSNTTAAAEATPVSNGSGQNTQGANLNFDVQNNQNKKRKFPTKIVIACTAVLLVVALVVLNLSTIFGALVKTFGSGSDYMRYVEAKEITSLCKSVSKNYGDSVLKLADSNTGAKADFSLSLSDKGADMINELASAGSGVDLEWLKDVKLNLDVNRSEKKNQVKAGLNINGKDIVSADLITDLENGDIYIAIPELSEKYMMQSVSESYDADTVENMNKLFKALPNQNTLDKLLEKYLKIAVNSINDVEKSEETLSIGDIDEKCTVLTFDVDERLLLEIAQKVLDEAEKDNDLKKVVDDFVKAAEDIYGPVEIDYNEAISDAKEEVSYALESLDDDGEKFLTLVDYVNGSHEIIGRKLIVSGEEVLSYGTAKRGSDFEFELNAGESFVVSGKGNESGSKITGEFSVEADGQEVVVIETEKLDMNKMKGGELEGIVRFKPGSALNGLSGISAPVAIPDFAAEMNFFNKGFDLRLLLQEDELVKLTTKAETKGSSNVDIPKEDNVCELDDQDDMQEYIESINFDDVINRLKDAGVDDEIIDAVEAFEESMSYAVNY